MGAAVSLTKGGFLNLNAINFVFYRLPTIWNNDGASLFNELSNEANRHGATLSLSGITTFTPKFFYQGDVVTSTDWDNARQMVDTIMQELNTMLNDFEIIDNTYHISANFDTTYHVFYGIQNLDIDLNDTVNDPDIASEDVVNKIIKKAYFILRLMAYFWDVFDETVQRRHSANLQQMTYLRKFSEYTTINRTAKWSFGGTHISGKRFAVYHSGSRVTIYDLKKRKKYLVVYVGSPNLDAISYYKSIDTTYAGYSHRTFKLLGAEEVGSNIYLIWSGMMALQTTSGYWSLAVEYVVVDKVVNSKVIEREFYFSPPFRPAYVDSYYGLSSIDGTYRFDGTTLLVYLICRYGTDEQNGNETGRIDYLKFSIDRSTKTTTTTRTSLMYMYDSAVGGGYYVSRSADMLLFAAQINSPSQEDGLIGKIDAQGNYQQIYSTSTSNSIFHGGRYNAAVGVEREDTTAEYIYEAYNIYNPYTNGSLLYTQYVGGYNRESLAPFVVGTHGIIWGIDYYNGSTWTDKYHNIYVSDTNIVSVSKTYSYNRPYLTKPSFANTSWYNSQYSTYFFTLNRLPFTGTITDTISNFQPLYSMTIMFVPPLIGSHYRHYEDKSRIVVEENGTRNYLYTQGLPIYSFYTGKIYNIIAEYDIPVVPSYDRFNLWYIQV